MCNERDHFIVYRNEMVGVTSNTSRRSSAPPLFREKKRGKTVPKKNIKIPVIDPKFIRREVLGEKLNIY